jgi:hypothetical protein
MPYVLRYVETRKERIFTHGLTEVRSFGGTQPSGGTQSFGVVGAKPESTHVVQ